MTDYPPIAFVDTETLGLDPRLHPIWEIAVIVDDVEHLWQVEVTVGEHINADQIALDINGFADRYHHLAAVSKLETAHHLAELLQGRHIVGAVPSFDEERVRGMFDAIIFDALDNEDYATAEALKPNGRYPWHYHLIDVEALAVGWLCARDGWAPELPWKSDDLTAALGLPVLSEDDRHTALGDARWAKAIYEKVTQ